MAPGTYTLLLDLQAPLDLEVGALGPVRFQAGAYGYTGSAFGSGGLDARLARHRRLAAGESTTRHWHVDYLLAAASLEAAFTAPGEAVECAVARALPGERVTGFGASDCDCEAHLVYVPEPGPLRRALGRRYGSPVGEG